MTLKTDMKRALDDEENDKMKDVTLVGSDGGRVSANKAVLAIRSPVFQRMFFGNFQERHTDEVPMDYPSVVLQVVVKYCYSDELDLDLIYADDMDHNSSSNNNNNGEQEEEVVDRLTDAEAVALVQAREAANYLELFELHKAVSNELGESIIASNHHTDPENVKKDLACICAVLQELLVRGGSDDPLFLTCLDLVASDIEACLLPRGSTTHNRGILACSIPLLEKLLEMPSINDFVAAKALQLWNREHRNEDKDDVDPTESERLQKMAAKVNLEQISAAQLAVIKPCELFPMERLYEAFVFHGHNKTPAKTSSPLFAFPTKTATIRGAGLDCVNGVYSCRVIDSIFQRRANYGDTTSFFRLEKKGSIWKIVVDSNDLGLENHGLVLYESDPQPDASSSSPSKPDVPPFALWTCVDGKGPTPYVRVLGSTPAQSFAPDTMLAGARRAELPVANAHHINNRSSLGTIGRSRFRARR